MRSFILIVFCIFFSLSAIAQKEMIEGRVIDESGKGIAYVNVVLINRSDSSFIQGAVTDEAGVFHIATDRCQEQLLKFSSVGYQDVLSDVKGGDFVLPTIAYGMEEITVSGKRPVYRMKGTSFITDVKNSLLSRIGSANDVLRLLPGVTGGEGEFNVFGKGKATIYINERLVHDATELERLNSNDISSVELINNPGANYGAERRAILKIHTKKATEGFAARLRLRGVQNHYFSDLGQLNISYATNRVNWYSSLYSSGPKNRVDGRNLMIANMPDTLYRLSMNMMDWEQRSRYYTLESGVGITMTEGHEIGTSYAYDYSRDIYEGDDLEDLWANGILAEKLSNYSYSKNKYNQHKVNLYYQGKIAEKLNINLNADYVNRNARNGHNVSESSTEDIHNVNTSSNLSYNLYAAKLVLGYTFWKGTLELGTDLSLMKNNQTYENKGVGFPNSQFDSEERKTAGFLNYTGNMGKLGWNVGLRYEQFHAIYHENKEEKPTVERIYKELYPTASLTYPIGSVSLSLAYSKRTSRPTFYQLRNSMEYSSRFLYSRGNPYLRSSQIHDLSLNAGYRFLQFSIGYYYTKNWIRLTDELSSADPLAIILFHTNEPKYKGISAQLTFQHKIGLWNPTWTAGVYRNFLDMKDYQGIPINLDSPYGQFTLNNTFSLGKGYSLNLDAFYTTAGAQGESLMRSEASMDIGLRKSFFKGALDVSLQYWDVFKSAKSRSTIFMEHVKYERWNYNDSRTLRLTLTFHFKKYQNKYKGENSSESDIRRM